MSKTNQTTKRYFKLGPSAESFFDPFSRMKVSRAVMGMIEPPFTLSKTIQNAIKGGQIVEVSQDEYLAFKASMKAAAPPAAVKPGTTYTPEALAAAVAKAKEEGFAEGVASVEIPEAQIGETMPENMEKMSLEDLTLAAVKLNELTLESVKDVLAMTKKADVIAFIEQYFDPEQEEEEEE